MFAGTSIDSRHSDWHGPDLMSSLIVAGETLLNNVCGLCSFEFDCGYYQVIYQYFHCKAFGLERLDEPCSA